MKAILKWLGWFASLLVSPVFWLVWAVLIVVGVCVIVAMVDAVAANREAGLDALRSAADRVRRLRFPVPVRNRSGGRKKDEAISMEETMTDTMIVVPIQTPPDPTCPKCGKLENKRIVCAHCGYVYENPGGWFQGCLAAVAILVFVCWLVLTLGYWVLNSDVYSDDFTLLSMLKSQWEWVKCLRVW